VASATPSQAAAPETAQPAATGADSLVGHWEGIIDVANQKIAIRADFSSEGGALQAKIDFPTQGALGLAGQNVVHETDKIHFEVLPAPRTAVFEGRVDGADRVAGSFSQSGFTGAFTLERKALPPAEVPPYREEEVKWQNGNVTLAGTLTLPQGPGPFPAVVLITGSGAQNRDEEIFGFKIFRVLADYLTRQGIAVLRYDDRGVGGSSAGTSADTSATFAGDVLGGVNLLKGRPDIDPQHIGLLGHSEGGLIAPMVATQTPDVAFVILMSGPGLPGRQVIEAQGTLIAKADGVSDAEIAKQATLRKQVVEAAVTGEGLDAARASIRKQYDDAAAALTPEQRKAIPDVKAWVDNSVESQMNAMTSPWMKYFLTYDPAPALAQTKVPVLALFGGKDLQVPAEANQAAIMAALDRGGNQDHTAKVFPQANHLYQAATTGSPNEYATLKPEFVDGFLKTIGDWILAHTKSAGQ
jgi:pimeloyl-ACP methyl ester carboxylesterase